MTTQKPHFKLRAKRRVARGELTEAQRKALVTGEVLGEVVTGVGRAQAILRRRLDRQLDLINILKLRVEALEDVVKS